MAPDDSTAQPQEAVDKSQNQGFVYRYVSVIDRYPLFIISLIVLFNIVCGAVALFFYDIPSFEEPRLGLSTRNTELSARDLSFVKFLHADEDTLSPLPRTYYDDAPPTSAYTAINHGDEERTPSCPMPDGNHLKIIYKSSSDGATLFDADSLKSICQHEDRLVRAHHSFVQNCSKVTYNASTGDICCPSWSLGYVVASLSNKSSCYDINQTDVEAVLHTLRECSKLYLSDGIARTVNRNECAEGSLVHTIFQFLTPKSFAENIKHGPPELLFTASFSPVDVHCHTCNKSALLIYEDNFQDLSSLDDGKTKLVALDFGLKFTLFDRLIISDFRFVALGVLTVAIIIWTYTGSLVVMIGSLLNMLFSTTLAYFLYHVVFQISFFPFTNLASLVLVIGIGADDTFVFVDLWKAAKDKLRTYRDKHTRILALQDATRHATLTILVTTLTTSGALYTTMSSNIIVVKCFAVFAGTALLANFTYTITWLPAIIVLHDKYFTFNKVTQKTDTFESSPRTFLRCIRKSCRRVRHLTKTVVFHTVLPKVIYSLRYVFIVVSGLLAASGFVFTFFYPRLKLQEGTTFQLFKNSQPFESYDQFYKNDLAFTESKNDTFPIACVWGILQTQNQNRWDPVALGQLELDPDFQMGDNATQNWLLRFCEDIKQQPFFGNKTSFCFIDSFKELMGRPCLGPAQLPCCNQDVFPFSESIFEECAKRYSVFLGRIHICQTYVSGLPFGNSCQGYVPGLRFDRNDSIRALYLYFDSSVLFSLVFQPVDTFWKDLLRWSTEKISTAPEGLSNGWCYSKRDEQLSLYDLLKGIPRGTFLTISIALVLTTVVLLITTRNLLVTLYAVMTISFTVVSTIGCLVWLGWELNLFESIMFTLTVGLSVDFSIHFGVAYGIAPYPDRKERTIFVIKTLGSSITAAAVSTFAAGAVMIPAVVLSYYQTGIFLMVAMASSWYYSMFLFLPLCFVIGPKRG